MFFFMLTYIVLYGIMIPLYFFNYFKKVRGKSIMKKIAVIVFAALSIAVLCMPVSAANNPFQRMTVTENNVEGSSVVADDGRSPNSPFDTNPDGIYDANKLFHLYWDTDSSTWAHGNINVISYLEPYGIGYGHQYGTQYIENLDFGENGADKVIISLTNTAEPFSGLGIYLDVNPVKDKNAQPIATLTGVLTEGFEDVNAQDFSVDVNISGGIHTVYFMYLGMDVGSFFGAEFKEAAPQSPAPESQESKVPDPAPFPAPKTGETGIFMIFPLFLCAVFFAVYKKRTLS